jgi:hypothetical protein
MTASSEQLDLSKRASVRSHQAWQTAAFDYYDQIGELKFAFGLISQIVARVMLYVAVTEDPAEVPIDAKIYLEDNDDDDQDKIKEAVDIGIAALHDLFSRSIGQSEMLRSLALNLSIPGEAYLVDDTARKRWTIASISELVAGTPPSLRTTRPASNTATMPGGRPLDPKAYVARIFRSHPRWSDEPDSSMLGVLDQAEKVVLFDQAMRVVARSRMNAGAIYIPNGMTAKSEKTLEESLLEATMEPVTNEQASHTVTPLLITGPPELGAQIKYIELGRKMEDELLTASDRALDRMLAGLDIPKDIVAGMAEVRYSNSVVIDDSLYKAHIEPLVLLICDGLTQAYLRPILRSKKVDEDIISRMTIWYNPSQIVTRPDRSQAANEGFDRFLLSGEAWRRARGYSDLDAPTDEEVLKRFALAKIQVPPELAGPLVENLNPEFFDKLRTENQSESGVPPELSEILKPGPDPSGAAPAEAPPTETTTRTNEASGGPLSQGGSQPTRNLPR